MNNTEGKAEKQKLGTLEPLYNVLEIAELIGKKKAYVYRCKEAGLLQVICDNPIIATEEMVRNLFNDLKDPANRKKVAELHREKVQKRKVGKPAGSPALRNFKIG